VRAPAATDAEQELRLALEEQRVRCEALAAEAAELSRRLEEVHRSRSWRLTAPLRTIRSRADGS
jgi:hypothetical protein